MRKTTAIAWLAVIIAFSLLIGFRQTAVADTRFYWENTLYLSDEGAYFPQALCSDTIGYVVWQEANLETGDIFLSASISTDEGRNWKRYPRFAGPYRYSFGSLDTQPSIFSLSQAASGKALVALSQADNGIAFWELGPDENPRQSSNIASAKTFGGNAPRLFYKGNGSFILLLAQGVETDGKRSATIEYSLSQNGSSWTDFSSLLQGDPGLEISFYPSYINVEGIESIVFQSRLTTDKPTNQLYLKQSLDGGKTWSKAKRLTDFEEYFTNAVDPTPDSWDNQRPFLIERSGQLVLAWERSFYGTNSQIYYVTVEDNGRVIGTKSIRVSNGVGRCRDPRLFYLGEDLSAIWYDNSDNQKDHVYLARNLDSWSKSNVSGSGAQSEGSFGIPVFIKNRLLVVWQDRQGSKTPKVAILRPDRTVDPPILSGQNFTSGLRIRSEVARLSWKGAADPSGIAGYSFIWTRDPSEDPPELDLNSIRNTNSSVEKATEDGLWYFAIRQRDNAGNWSATSRIEFNRSMKPPPSPRFADPPTDEYGYLGSNTFDLTWVAPDAPNVAGYSYALSYLAPDDSGSSGTNATSAPSGFERDVLARYKALVPPNRVLTKDSLVRYDNLDNGIYAFSVVAFDDLGNVSDISTRAFRLNKYVPYTVVTYLEKRFDEFGSLFLNLIGRGFRADGAITAVFIDRDGVQPWDRSFELAKGDYAIPSDSRLQGIKAEGLEPGLYRLILEHSSRGRYTAPARIQVDSMGTVKFGDFEAEPFKPAWTLAEDRGFAFPVSSLLLVGLILICLFGIVFSSRGVAKVVGEGRLIEREVRALITGDIMPMEKKERAMKSLKKRGFGLRLKFSFFTSGIVISVVLLVSITIGFTTSQTQENALLKGLKDRTMVFLDSLTTSALNTIKGKDRVDYIVDLQNIPSQLSSMSEAVSITVSTSPKNPISADYDYVQASNDASISQAKIAGGDTKLNDAVSALLPEMVKTINQKALSTVSSLTTQLASISTESLGLVGKTDEASNARKTELDDTRRTLNAELSLKLAQLGKESAGSIPSFSITGLDRQHTVYRFFEPIVYYDKASNGNFVYGMARLDIKTDLIIKEINDAQTTLVMIVSVIALIAVGIGILGALLLAAIIIGPIKALAKGVVKIRDTEDKEELAEHVISVRSRDEIFDLAETVNQMTRNLVSAAKAAKDLTVGKEIQKQFMTLETDMAGRKLTTVKTEDNYIEVFGYYEGAKGVSGDYFDFKKLDETHYAFIKCDVSGKGVPAALIMIEVATLFLNYFRGWEPGHPTDLSELVIRVNDLIEERGFAGRFAAFSMGIMDTASGAVQFCNAGDNVLHTYSASEGIKKSKTVPSGPTAGTFPTDLVMMKSGFPKFFERLNKGDILFLYTDGVEEAKRYFRDEKLNVIKCSEPGLAQDEKHESHTVGQVSEEMGNERIDAIINAVMSKGRFTLKKWHDPSNELYEFDFSKGNGSLEECLLALVSVEKAFRMYHSPKATDMDKVIVDKKIEDFLRKYFVQFANFCKDSKPLAKYPEYNVWSGIKEDEQYDDLTLLAFRKK